MLLWDDLYWWVFAPKPPLTATERIAPDWIRRVDNILNDPSGSGDVVAAGIFAHHFEARWGTLSLEALVRVAHYYADNPADLGLQQWMFIREEVDGQTAEVAYEALFAVTALGMILTRRPHDVVTAQAADALARYLTHPSPRACWSSAIWLGWLHDARALPNLAHMLTEYLPPHTVSYPDGYGFFYEDWRSLLIPLILRVWRANYAGSSASEGESTGAGAAWLVGTLRQALLGVVALEEALPRPQGPEQEYFVGEVRCTGQEALQQYHTDRKPWIDYQHQIVYGLGRLGAFGALVGVPTPPGIYGPGWTSSNIGVGHDAPVEWRLSNAYAEDHADRFRADLWRVEACCGALEAEFHKRMTGHLLSFESVPAFAHAVVLLLAQQFGLTVAERRQAMMDYVNAHYFYVTAEYYQCVEQEEQWDKAGADAKDEVEQYGQQPHGSAIWAPWDAAEEEDAPSSD